MSALFQDLRYTFRLFRRAPGITALAVLSLALGIGANAGIFSVVEALGLRPLPVRDEARLVRISASEPGERRASLSYEEFQALRKESTLYSGFMAHGLRGAGIVGPSGEMAMVISDVVSGDYFETLGITPALGRPFRRSEEFAGAAPAIAISDGLWHRQFGGDPRVVGKPVRVGKTMCELAAVMKPEFRGTRGMVAPDVWIPFETWNVMGGNRNDFDDPNSRWLDVTARLRDGAALDRAKAEVAVIAGRLAMQRPETARRRTFDVQSERQAREENLIRLAGLLFAIVGLVLLIACANVAGLLLGRAEDRRHELGVRLAVGATRGRLVRQMLVESCVLSILSGCAGWVLAMWLVRALPALIPSGPVEIGVAFELNRRIFAFTAILALVTGPFFGLLPAWRASRTAVLRSLHGGADAVRLRRLTLRDGLVVLQVAISAAVLVGSGLLVRSLVKSEAIDPGFSIRQGLVVTVAPPSLPDKDARLVFSRSLVERAGSLPGATGATIANRLPLGSSGGGAVQQVVAPDSPVSEARDVNKLHFSIVDDRYFRVVGTRVVAGRSFAASDVRGRNVVVVSETMARKFWPGGDAVGRRILVGEPPDPRVEYEVVGVAQDGRYNEITEDPQPYVYFLWGQRMTGDVTLVVGVQGDERAAAEGVKTLLHEMAPGMPTMRMITIREHLRFSMAEPRVVTILVSALGAVGLVLAMTGLYGVVMHLVLRRSREIGIRMALGATPRQVLLGVLGRSVMAVAIGLAIGSAAAISLGGSLRGALYGVAVYDPVTHLTVALLLVTVAMAATIVPARRAARVDPVKTLRAE